MAGVARYPALTRRLEPHTTGKSRLYVKRLVDLDPAVLRELVAASVAWVRERYPVT